MAPRLGNLAVASARRAGATSPKFPARPCGYHRIDPASTFDARDCVCHHDARSPRSEGAHVATRISVILDGSFHVRARHGSAVVGPGTLLLGNAGAAYEFHHLDDGGDRSIVFTYDEPVLQELGSAGFRRLCIPASPSSAAAVALAHDALWSAEPDAIREAALAAADVAITAERAPATATRASADQRPISQVLRYIEAHHADDCSLAALAAHAGLSSFYFLRRFRATTGQTPRQVVIATRLRAAASLLRATRAPILDIALDVGFGDLSHFTTSFARAFGVSPGRYRRSGA